MSIRIMSRVWDSCIKDRGELLVMLALADFANDAGECWPSMRIIAQKSRMTPRSAQRICRELEAKGALSIFTSSARAGCNMYRLTPDARVTPDTVSPLTPASPPPDARVTPPLTRASPEPSLNHQEPSEEPPYNPPTEKPRKPDKAALPESWVPDDDCEAYAAQRGLLPDEIRELADDFRGYWSERTDAGAKKTERGWRQTWRNRCIDMAPRIIRARGGGPGPHRPRNAMVDAFAQVAAERASRSGEG